MTQLLIKKKKKNKKEKKKGEKKRKEKKRKNGKERKERRKEKKEKGEKRKKGILKSGYLLSIPPRLLSGTSLIMVVIKKKLRGKRLKKIFLKEKGPIYIVFL